MIAAIKDNRNPTTDEHRQVLLLVKMSRNDQNIQVSNILWNYYNHKSANKTLDRCQSDMLIMINTIIIANIIIVVAIGISSRSSSSGVSRTCSPTATSSSQTS